MSASRLRVSAALGSYLLGHDPQFISGIAAPLEQRYRDLIETQTKKLRPRPRTDEEAI
jgi:hypothetical protein